MDPHDEPPAFSSGYGQLPLRQRRARKLLGLLIIVIILSLIILAVFYFIIYLFIFTYEECMGPGPVLGRAFPGSAIVSLDA